MSSATLTVTITATDDGVTVTASEDYTGTSGVNGDQVVYESGLATGSSTNVSNTQVISSFTIEALDGLSSVDFTIGATTTTFTATEIEALSITSQSVTTAYGTLVLNGYTQAASGVITIAYTYTLTSAPNVDAADTMDNISITAHDRGGAVTSGNDTLSIKIIDDVPTAVNNANVNVVEGAITPITGNVITNDTQGADTAALHEFTYTKTAANGGGTETLTFDSGNTIYTIDTPTGALTVNEDGTWEFTPVSTYDHTQADTLGSFTYTLIDGDGDISNSATQTITVTDTTPTIGSATTVSVDEDDLTNGSAIVKDSLSVESSLEISPSQDSIDTVFNMTEGLVTGLTSGGNQVYYYLSADSKTLTASTSATEGGVTVANTVFTDTLSDTISSAAKHTFVLSGVIDHPAGNTDNTTTLTFGYIVTDSDTDTVTSSFSVNIVDDVPTAVSEADLSVVEGNIALTGMIDLLANDVPGADEATTLNGFTYTNESAEVVTGTIGVEMNTQYGFLTVNSDGSWSYRSDLTENNPSGVTDTFTYTIIDNDGDTSSATQDIIVTDGADPTINNANNTLVTVYEGDATSTFNGTDSYNESNSLADKSTTSTLTHKLDFTPGTDSAGITSFIFDGTTRSITVGSSATVTDDDKGVLTVYYDGTWEYTPPATYIHPDGSGVNYLHTTFTYTVTDTDGDIVDTGSQTIQVDDTLGTITGTTDVSVKEENLSTGTVPNAGLLTQSGTISLDISNLNGTHDVKFSPTQTDATLNAPALTSQGQDINYVVSADGHTLTAYTGADSTLNHVFVVTMTDPTGPTPGYTVELLQPLDHETALLENGNLEFDLNISLNDDDNDNDVATIKISIVDDAPLDTQTLLVNEEGVTGAHDTSTTINTNADATGSNTTITTNGTYGDAVINADGTLTYTPSYDGSNSIATNYSGIDTVIYQTTLDDGTTKDTTVTITVNPLSDAPGVTRDAATVYTLEDDQL